MANSIRLATCAFLALWSSFNVVHGQPINPEEAASLLPEIPKTKNETVAAIVQDAVVQDAVQSIVGEGTLSGLVVKKNTIILHASKPDVILSQNEQILTAPVSRLEDIRKNITETIAATSERDESDITEVDEVALSEVIPVDSENLASSEQSTEEKTAATANGKDEAKVIPAAELPQITKIPDTRHKWEVPGIVQSDIILPEGVYPQSISLPPAVDEAISSPLVAVLHPKNVTGFRGSVIALLPTSTESPATEEPGERIPVAIIEGETPAFEIEYRGTPDGTEVSIDQAGRKNSPGIFTRQVSGENEDMDTAEDIIFRPLFRYHQEQNERTRVQLENRAYRQRDNRRRYRPSASNEYYGYNPYGRPQRPRNYDDY